MCLACKPTVDPERLFCVWLIQLIIRTKLLLLPFLFGASAGDYKRSNNAIAPDEAVNLLAQCRLLKVNHECAEAARFLLQHR
jgi:hypothetical protein